MFCILFAGSIFKYNFDKWCVKLENIYCLTLAFIDNLPHLCKHLNFQEDETEVKAVLGTLLNLMEDPDKDVRVAFSGNIKYILESLDSEDGFIKEVRIFKLKFKLKHRFFYKCSTRTFLINKVCFSSFLF